MTEINTNTITSITEDDQHLSTRTLVSLLHMPKMSMNRILMQELKMKRVCSMHRHMYKKLDVQLPIRPVLKIVPDQSIICA